VRRNTFRIKQSEAGLGNLVVRLAFLCAFLFGNSFFTDGLAQDRGRTDISGIATNEVLKRQQQVQSAQALFTAGSKAYSDRSYGEAMDHFRAAYETTPQVPATAEMRIAFFKRYQRASLSFAEVLISEAKWAEAQRTLEDVYSVAESGDIPERSLDVGVRKTLARLKSQDHYNMANSPLHIKNMDEVKTKLITAKGYRELGDYDRALQAYNRVLVIDPYNRAARRGQEIVERHILDYTDAARNHTRSAMLREVAKGWEKPVPNLGEPDFVESSNTNLATGGRVVLETKLQKIMIPRLEFEGARLMDVVEVLIQKSIELDVTESNPLKKGVNIVINSSGAADDPSQKILTVKLSNVPLGVALQYATQQVGMKYIVDDYAVSVVPLSAATDSSLVVGTFPVPPGFIQGGGDGAAVGGGTNDPFAPAGENSGGTLVVRITAEEFLKQQGVKFGPGAVAQYINGNLIVKNTVEQVEVIKALVQGAKDSGSKNVEVRIKMVSVRDDALNQAGLDFLLGAGGASSSSVFFQGGTNGNSSLPAIQADYPFPIGTMTPVTSGLRTGIFSSSPSIDDLLVGATSANGVAPGVFAVNGLLTDPQFGMVLRALSQMKGTDQLCDAYVTVNPGQKARIEQIREFIYPTEYDPPEIPNQASAGGGGIVIILPPPLPPIIVPGPTQFIPVSPATPTAFEMRPVGKIIEVQPNVSEDNKAITVNILADFTDFSGFINYGTPIFGGITAGVPTVLTPNRILMPVFDVVRETTDVTVWDGGTIVIGGFHGETIEDTEDKIPIVGDLPLAGNAFRSTSVSHRKRALLIFVSVRLIDPGGNLINAELDDLAAQ